MAHFHEPNGDDLAVGRLLLRRRRRAVLGQAEGSDQGQGALQGLAARLDVTPAAVLNVAPGG